MRSIPKFEYFRSKEHLKNVSALECQHCGIDGHTQAAHSNWAFHGKGRGIKASDQYTAALCHFCHYELDQGKNLNRLERQALWFNAWHKTVAKLQQQGKWPEGIECEIHQDA